MDLLKDRRLILTIGSDGGFDVDIEFACKLSWSFLAWLNETLLTEKQAAGFDSVHIDTFRRWRRDGIINPTTEDWPFMYRLSDVIPLRRR